MVTLQNAPGDLERVRELLNSWLVPNDTRTPTDQFERFARRFHSKPASELTRLRSLRDDLRRVVERSIPESDLNRWIGRLGVRPSLADGASSIDFQHRGGLAGEYLAMVLRAIRDGTWGRLKACPDCRWTFYDSTRNGTKRWCLMNAGGPSGRACGTIAKVRRFRERHRLEDAVER